MPKHLFSHATGYGLLCLVLCWSAGVVQRAEAFETLHQAALTAFRAGDFATAAEQWEGARQHPRVQLAAAAHAEMLVQLAQAYFALGHYHTARARLDTALILARQASKPDLAVRVRAHLGHVHAASGALATARTYLQDARADAQRMQDDDLTALVLNFWGDWHVRTRRPARAMELYDQSAQAAQRAGNTRLMAESRLQLALTALSTDQAKLARAELDTAAALYRNLPDTSVKAQGLLRAGCGLITLLEQAGAPDGHTFMITHDLLREAARIAAIHHDLRTQAYVWGYIGQLYAMEKRYIEALQLTRRAIWAAQQVQAPEILYLWEWQRGRLFMLLEDPGSALPAYRRALDSLALIRNELTVSGNPHGNAFTARIEPLFFELVDILLLQAAARSELAQAYRMEARHHIETLRQAQIRHYFQDECVVANHFQPTPLEEVTLSAAVIYPIVLPTRLELLMHTSQGLVQYTLAVPAHTLNDQVKQLQTHLGKRTTRQFLRPAQKLYDWLIRPLQDDLEAAGVDTLVFVPYGALLTVPMAALHDGRRFVVEQYATALIPGLSLTDPRPLPRAGLHLLAAGLTEASQGFPALPFVKSELHNITRLFDSRLLLDDQFRLPVLKEALLQAPFNVLHIASHGQFAGNSQDTFLLTHDGQLTLDELDRYIGYFHFREDPLELLTLSACQTAAGDMQAALGLAGIAIKAGARSALATLWHVSDQAASDLVFEFYRHLLQPHVSKAQALQRAQLGLLQDIRFQHPAYWAAFLMINNWL